MRYYYSPRFHTLDKHVGLPNGKGIRVFFDIQISESVIDESVNILVSQ